MNIDLCKPDLVVKADYLLETAQAAAAAKIKSKNEFAFSRHPSFVSDDFST